MSGVIRPQEPPKNHENKSSKHKGTSWKTQPAASCHRVSHPRKTLEEDEKMDRFGDNYLNLLGGRVLPDAACLAASCLEVGGRGLSWDFR